MLPTLQIELVMVAVTVGQKVLGVPLILLALLEAARAVIQVQAVLVGAT
jgi:hypothetical protein